MKKERIQLERISTEKDIPNSITELYDTYFRNKSNISNRNGLIYLLDIPDNLKPTLPTNAQRWCNRSDTLLTDFNRWLWEFGKNAPDLEQTWKRGGTTPGTLWSMLSDAFGQE